MAQDWFDQGTTRAGSARPSGGATIQTRPADPKLPGQIQGQGLSNAEKSAGLPYVAPTAEADLTRKRQQIGDRNNERSDKLRNDFIGDQRVKEYTAVLPQLMAGLASAPTAQGDNALIYAYAKIMDPGSAVREQEGDAAANTAGFWDAKVEQIKKSIGYDGARGLPLKAVQGLRDEMNRKVAALAKSYGVARADYQDRAKRQGVAVEDVVGRSPAAGFEKQYMELMGDRLKDQPSAIVTPQAQEIDPTGANSRLSPQDRDFISANARYMTPEGMKRWYADKGMSISDKEAQDAYAYYQGGGQQDAAVNAPQGEGSAVGRLAASPVGAYFGGAANGLFPGVTDEMAGGLTALAGGDYSSARDYFNSRKQAQADANPTANLLGTITGGGLALAAPGAALSRLGVGGAEASTLAPRLLAEDALYGGAYGAGENNDNRLMGGLTGTLEGAGGGVIGRGGTRALGMAFRGAKSAASQAPRLLRDQGINMTIPQMVGGRLKTLEDRLSGFQGIGNRIADQRRGGLEDLNRAGWRQVYEAAGEVPPGVIGEEGVDAFKAARQKLYSDALDGKSFDLNGDPAFAQDITGAWQLGTKIPDRMGKEFAHTVGLASSNLDNGILTGGGYQAALKRLRGDRSSFASDPRGGDFADAIGLVENAFTNAVGRADPDVIPALERANRFYREGSILKDATSAARNTGMGVWTPSQLTNAAEKSGRKFGGTDASTDRPFFELTRAAQQVLPSTIPDSGTAGRISNGPIRDTLRELAYAPLYAEPVRKAVGAGMFAGRPAQVERAGDILVNKAAYPAGSLGALLGLQYGQ